MAKDIRKHILISKHELDLIQCCIRYNITSIYNLERLTQQQKIELSTLIGLSAKLEDRWFNKR